MSENDIGTIERQKEKTKKPSKYKVILHNDDYSHPMLVVSVIMKVFQKTDSESLAIMHEAHTTGKSICGIYPKDTAETKAMDATELAKANGNALLFTIEKD